MHSSDLVQFSVEHMMLLDSGLLCYDMILFLLFQSSKLSKRTNKKISLIEKSIAIFANRIIRFEISRMFITSLRYSHREG